ncbi:MAG: hypothetical protein ACK2UM_02275 [Anaerolineales bacterium]|jgi:hypothetical protein
MAKEYEDAFDNELFDDWGAIQPGNVISPLRDKLRYRQGNDPVDWSSPGGSKYLPRDWQMQCGAAKDTFTARSFGGFEITFPVAFGDNPVFVCSVAGTLPAFTAVSQLQAIPASAAVMEVYWWSAANITRIYVNWIAIGPIGIG